MTSDKDRPAIPPESAESKARWRQLQRSLPLREKVRILLKLQRQHLPLLQRLRRLEPWEKPWPIEP
jgi:hypothetical protein